MVEGTRCRLAARYEDLCELDGASGILGCLHRAGKHNVVVDDFSLDVGVFNEAGQIAIETGDIALDGQVNGSDLFAFRTEDKDVGVADLLAENVDAAGCP